MKEFPYNPEKIKKLEFGVATSILVIAIIVLGINFSENKNFDLFIAYLLQHTFIYSTFLLLNFIIVPRLQGKTNKYLNIAFIVLIYLLISLSIVSTNNYMYEYVPSQFGTNILTRSPFLQAYWVLLLFGLYFAIKYSVFYLFNPSETIDSKYRIIVRDGLIAYVIWMVSMILLFVGRAEGEIIIAWSTMIPFAIAFYSLLFFYLIPRVVNKKYPFLKYLFRSAFILAICYLPPSLFNMLLTYEEDDSFALGAVNVFFQFFITTPLSWWLFKRHIKGNEELYVLKKELGRSNANFDFLRSQINPHFLFNALNTIYGTALQEGAERTSEGIEKLGEMMRFMLQENMQEKIALVREIDYLNNYIALQRLRTDPNPTIKIEAHIDEQPQLLQIAPMLLIPFVENAFKHGISFREPSHIKVTLEITGKTLNFDVYNSKHARVENDPERGKSGIGLNNVKQRLELLYPSKHELIIRETGKEYFVHLTIQLT